MAKMITRSIYPPIPDRRFDWTAYWDGEEERHAGWGATEAEAIADLQRLDQERWEAETDEAIEEERWRREREEDYHG